MTDPWNWHISLDELAGGFKYFLFSSLFGEMIQFDDHIFQMGGSTTNQWMVDDFMLN